MTQWEYYKKNTTQWEIERNNRRIEISKSLRRDKEMEREERSLIRVREKPLIKDRMNAILVRALVPALKQSFAGHTCSTRLIQCPSIRTRSRWSATGASRGVGRARTSTVEQGDTQRSTLHSLRPGRHSAHSRALSARLLMDSCGKHACLMSCIRVEISALYW